MCTGAQDGHLWLQQTPQVAHLRCVHRGRGWGVVAGTESPPLPSQAAATALVAPHKTRSGWLQHALPEGGPSGVPAPCCMAVVLTRAAPSCAAGGAPGLLRLHGRPLPGGLCRHAGPSGGAACPPWGEVGGRVHATHTSAL